MNRYFKISLFILIIFNSLISSAQTISTVDIDSIRGINKRANIKWLNHLQEMEISDQWNSISSHILNYELYAKKSSFIKFEPIIFIDGILIHSDYNSSIKKELLELLTVDKIKEISIIHEEPTHLYVNKEFTGYIIITLKEKKTLKRLKPIIK